MDLALINLDRTPDRLAAFARANAHLPAVKRYAAVDGRALDTGALIADGLITADILATYTQGSIGAACSHIGLWGIAAQADRAVTILEDDAVLHKDFCPTADALVAALPNDWDIVLWGWNFDSYLLFELLPGVSNCLAAFDQEQMRAGLAAFQTAPVSPHLFRLQRAFGCPCYSVSAKGAAKLRRHCIPLRAMSVFFPGLNRTVPNNGIDIMMNDAYPRLQAYVSFPPLAVTANRVEIRTSQQRD